MIQHIQKQDVLEINKKVINDWNKKHQDQVEKFAFGDIDQVIKIVNSFGNSGNYKMDAIEKASYLLGVVSWSQLFSDGNKRTAFVSAIKFLQRNGYDLNVKSHDEKKELAGLLYEIQEERSQLNSLTMKKIINFVTKHTFVINQNNISGLDEILAEKVDFLDYLGNEQYIKNRIKNA